MPEKRSKKTTTKSAASIKKPDKKVSGKPDPSHVSPDPIIWPDPIIYPTLVSLLNMLKDGKLVISVDSVDKDSLKELRSLTEELGKQGIDIKIGPDKKADI